VPSNHEESEAAVAATSRTESAPGLPFAPIGDETACLTWLWTTLYAPDGASAVCRRCRTVRRFHRVSRRRAYACDHCGNQVYPTAGTFMEGSGLGVATWFAAAALILAHDERIAPRALAQELGISYKTALRVKKKVIAARTSGGSDALVLEKLRREIGGSAETTEDSSAAARERSTKARDHIRAAACRAFAAQGPAATRIADIAREAGVSSAIIHYYYKSKDEVLLAALQWANEHTSSRLEELRETTADHVELLRRTLEMAVPSEGVLHDEYLLWLETWVRVRLHPELLAECVAMSARWTGFLEEIISDGERAGVFRPVVPPAELAQRLVAMSDGLSFRSAVGYAGMPVQRVSELLLSFAAEEVGVPLEQLSPGAQPS
jgi:AcrR family transcriptional regulator